MVFADTFYWIALTNPEDQHCRDALRFDQLLAGGQVSISEEVLLEVLTFFAGDTWLRSRAVETVRAIMTDPGVRIIPQTHQTFLAGFELYAARLEKGYSLIDCISMETIRREGILAVLTNDRHFEQEGFRALFREP